MSNEELIKRIQDKRDAGFYSNGEIDSDILELMTALAEADSRIAEVKKVVERVERLFLLSKKPYREETE